MATKKMKLLQKEVNDQRTELQEIKALLTDPEKAKTEAAALAELEKEKLENETLLEAARVKAEEVAAAATGDVHVEISKEDAEKTRNQVKGLLND